jgi:hypothetical protein
MSEANGVLPGPPGKSLGRYYGCIHYVNTDRLLTTLVAQSVIAPQALAYAKLTDEDNLTAAEKSEK